ITYWPIAEMVKSAAGITDDDPLEAAKQKLLECCGDEAIAELVGLASGVLEALEGERSPQELAWGVRQFAEELADVQPLIMVFEDIHWAEEPLLELIEHLAGFVRERPLLVICLARPELPDPLQARIAARIDRLEHEEKVVLQRAAVVGRIFWHGALEQLNPDTEQLDKLLEDLLLRDFLVPERRSSISGERAYRFKHGLI